MLTPPLFQPGNRNLGGSITDFSLFGGQPALNVNIGRAGQRPADVDPIDEAATTASAGGPAPDRVAPAGYAPAAAAPVEPVAGDISQAPPAVPLILQAATAQGEPASAPEPLPLPAAIGSSSVFTPPTILSDDALPPATGDTPASVTPIDGVSPPSVVADLSAGGVGSSISAPLLDTVGTIAGATIGSIDAVVAPAVDAAAATIDAATDDVGDLATDAVVAVGNVAADALTATADRTTAVQDVVTQVVGAADAAVADIPVVSDIVSPVVAPIVTDIVQPVTALATDPIADVATTGAQAVETVTGAVPPVVAAAADLVDTLATETAQVAAPVTDTVATTAVAATGVVGDIAATAVDMTIGAATDAAPVAGPAAPAPTVTDLFTGSDPAGGIQTLVGMVQAADTFDLGHVDAPAATVGAVGSIVDALASDTAEDGALLGGDDAAGHAADLLDLHHGPLGGLG